MDGIPAGILLIGLAASVNGGCAAQCTAMPVADLDFLADVSGHVEVGERTLLDDGSACTSLEGSAGRVEACQFTSSTAQETYLGHSPEAHAFNAGLPMTIVADEPGRARIIANIVAAELPDTCR